MRKTFIYGGFIIASIAVVIAFVTAKSVAQLAIAILLYPPLVYLAFKYIPRQPRKVPPPKPPIMKIQPISESEKEKLEIVDIDKRAFLKAIGAAGLSFFLFSLLSNKVGSLISGKTASNQVAPTESQPTDGYKISDIDNIESPFYGFTNKDGGWYIMKEDADTSSFRYAKGEANFPKNWDNRKNLKYDYFYNVFSTKG